MKSIRNPLPRESGFTIVELMVGMLIGLVSIIVMFQVFAVSEGQRRTTSGAGDAQQNGITSLYLMERDARMSGYGLNYYRLLGCTVNGYWAPSAQAFSFNLAPVTIANGAAGIAPDTLTFMYADTDTFAFPSVVSSPGTIGTTGFVRIKDERFTYKPGDLFVIGDVPLATASQILRPCSLFQVTALDATSSKQLNFAGNTYVDNGVTRAANYTPPTASSSMQVPPNNLTYPAWSNTNRAGARIFNLGSSPTVMRYSIVNNQLVSQNMLVPTEAATPIADGIVQLQAQYGISGATPQPNPTAGCQPAPPVITPCYVSPSAPSNTGAVFTIDNWADALPLGPGAVLPQNWRQIVAMRFVIVARSGLKEKADPATGICNTTTTLPVWSVNNRTLDVAAADPLEWKCYRYTKFEAVVPIRNMMWFPDPNGTNQDPSVN